MGNITYDWRAADQALRSAERQILAAQRHRNHRKRANVLNDLFAALCEIQKAIDALSVGCVVGVVNRKRRRSNAEGATTDSGNMNYPPA